MILGLRTAVYHVPDLEGAKAWYASAFQTKPYFDEPFYVGFNIGGYELGRDPNGKTSGAGGSVAYWGVAKIEQAVAHFTAVGAELRSPTQEVGEGIKVATFADPFGNLIGLIENPHFSAASAK
jgi:predicted enzyme related to lactoylglutathione lyase